MKNKQALSNTHKYVRCRILFTDASVDCQSSTKTKGGLILSSTTHATQKMDFVTGEHHEGTFRFERYHYQLCIYINITKLTLFPYQITKLICD